MKFVCRIFLIILLQPIAGMTQSNGSAITNETPVHDDTLSQIRSELESLHEIMKSYVKSIDELNTQFMESQSKIDELHRQLVKSDKRWLIAEYGPLTMNRPAPGKQFSDFQSNQYLEQFNEKDKLEIYYPFNEVSADLDRYAELKTLAAVQAATNDTIVIEGFTDSPGYEQNLSQVKQRCEAIWHYLVEKCGVKEKSVALIIHDEGSNNRFTEPETEFLNRRVIVSLKD